MGLFGKLFCRAIELPRLDPSGPTAGRLSDHMPALEPFVAKIHDRIELVPAEKTVYVYIGKPPGIFGLAWFENGQEVNFKDFTASRGLRQRQIQSLYGRLSEAYAAHDADTRYETTIAGKKVIVLPSDRLARRTDEIVDLVSG